MNLLWVNIQAILFVWTDFMQFARVTYLEIRKISRVFYRSRLYCTFSVEQKVQEKDKMASGDQQNSCGPFPVTKIRNMFHTLKDGTKLAMGIFVPWRLEEDRDFISEEAKKYTKLVWNGDPGHQYNEANKFPAILEQLPYGKEGKVTLARDFRRHPWFASHGFVCVRVDMRGTGESSGLYFDEYEPQELQDCIEMIDWLASRSWSNGKVGMYGKSWGGFNGLQVACEKPPALQAVISLFSTDDRYSDDIHYMGGCAIGNGMLPWAGLMLITNAQPPHPEFFANNEDWRKEYLYRCEKSLQPWDQIWLAHQVRTDPYWAQGSVNEDYDRIQCPCWTIGGYPDGYTNAPFRMAAKLNKSSRATIGQWAHQWPDGATPGPFVDYLNMCLDWFTYHLKGQEKARKDVSKWPQLNFFLQDSTAPSNFVKMVTGAWFDLPKWREYYARFESEMENPVGIRDKVEEVDPGSLTKWWFRGENELTSAPFDELTSPAPSVELIPHPVQGEYTGEWYCACLPDMPDDQTLPNSHSQCWMSSVLEQDLSIAGFTCVFLALEAEVAGKYAVAVRLCDQRPDGTSYRISYGMKNIAQWKGQLHPERNFPAKQKIVVAVLLNGVGYKVPKGNRLLISVTPSYYPTMFPMPNTRGLFFHPEESFVVFQTLPDHLKGNGYQQPGPCHNPFNLTHDVNEDETIEYEPWKQVELDGKKVWQRASNIHEGDFTFSTIGMQHTETTRETFLTNDQVDWGKTISERQMRRRFPNQDVDVFISTYSSMEGLKEEFILNNRVNITINGEEFFSREYPQVRIPRDYC